MNKKDSTQLNEQEAYSAMLVFLDAYYSIGHCDSLIDLLSSASWNTADGRPMDASLWDFWLEAIRKVKDAT